MFTAPHMEEWLRTLPPDVQMAENMVHVVQGLDGLCITEQLTAYVVAETRRRGCWARLTPSWTIE